MQTLTFCLAAALLLCAGGCAARLQTPNGNTWIVGLSRISTTLQALDSTNCVARATDYGAPIAFGLEPYGVNLAVALNRGAAGYVVPSEVTNRFAPPRTYGVSAGPREMPWRFGITHYRLPTQGSHVQAVVNTLAGIGVRLKSGDSAIRAGYSRCTITTAGAVDRPLSVEYAPSRDTPTVTITTTH